MYDDGPNSNYFVCTYSDGKVVRGLSYSESCRLFKEAQQTSNPCTISTPGIGYTAP